MQFSGSVLLSYVNCVKKWDLLLNFLSVRRLPIETAFSRHHGKHVLFVEFDICITNLHTQAK